MRVRTFTVAAMVVAASTAMSLLGAADAGPLAGGGAGGYYGFDPDGNIFTVEKVIDGPVPLISEPFTVEVSCVSTDAEPDLGPFTIKFGDDGLPADDFVFSVGANRTCTAVETVTNGAVVSYACAATDPAQCRDDQTAEFGDFLGAEATFTVTNSYEAQPPAEPAPPGAVPALPPFTG